MDFKNILNSLKVTLGFSSLPPSSTKRKLPWTPKAIWSHRKDMKWWKRAEQYALNVVEPRMYLLQELYTEIMNDALLSSQVNNRKQQVFSMPFILTKPNGEVDQEQSDKLKKSPVLRTLFNAVLDKTYFGYSLIELAIEKGELTATVLPRTNIVPSVGQFLNDYTDTSFVKYREMKEFGTWILEFYDGDFGLLNKAVPHVLMKRFAQSCWSELCEIYGIPPRVMKTNTTDKNALDRAEQMMSDMGSASWFIIDEMEDFQFAQGVTTKGEVYQELIRLCSNEMSLLVSGAIIGQDTANGNRSKDQSAQEMLWYLVQDDMNQIEQAMNNIIMPALVKHGVITDGLTFEFEQSEDKGELWTWVTGLLPYFNISPDYIKEKFNIEVTEKANNQQVVTQKLDADFFLKASAQTEAIQQTNCCTVPLISLSHKLNDDDLITRFWNDSGTRVFDAELFNFTASNLNEAFKKGWFAEKAKLEIGITYGQNDPASTTAYEMNIFRFSGAKTFAESQALNNALASATSYEDFRIKAAAITKIHNENWLQTEYVTANAVADSSATYERLSKLGDMFPYWQYRTVEDTKVRPEHALINGKILPFDHPLWKKIYPPNGWNCRCFVVPRTAREAKKTDLVQNELDAYDYLQSEDFQKATKSGFGINRAISKEVFTENQQYVQSLDQRNRLLSSLKPDNYDIKTPSNLPDFSTTKADKASIAEKAVDDVVTLRDYNNREVLLPTAVLESIDEALLPELQSLLNSPNEVWFNAAMKEIAFNEYQYIKYFSEGTYLITAKLNSLGSLTISKFEKISDFEVNRWGLLIKN